MSAYEMWHWYCRWLTADDAVDADDLAEDDTAANERIYQLTSYHQAQRQSAYLIKFFVRIRGARTPPPRIDAPVTNIPLAGCA